MNSTITPHVVAELMRVVESGREPGTEIQVPEDWAGLDVLEDFAREVEAHVLSRMNRASLILPNGLLTYGDAATIETLQLLLYPQPLPAADTGALVRKLEAAGFRFGDDARIVGTMQNFRLLLSPGQPCQ